MPAPDWLKQAHLWLVTDEQAAAERGLCETVRLALQGGVDAVLCRLKTQTDLRVYELACKLRKLCGSAGVPFVMSHHIVLGRYLDAAGVQLGHEDVALPAARAMLPTGMTLGYSCHSVAEARAAFNAGADYVFLGPVFATPEKLKYGPPLGVEIVSAAQELPGPVVFIGGIDFDNAAEISSRGGQRIAAIRALLGADEPASAASSLRWRLGLSAV